MAEQWEIVIKVNLQCPRCYKKIKKILCEIPQVKDPAFDEKQNKVTITVVCDNPAKIQQKIYCKGRKIILCIDIKKVEPKKPEPEPKPKPLPPPPPKPVIVTGQVYVCLVCHNRGCGQFCPCNCHCGRPPMCGGGCGKPVPECTCGRPPMCGDGCGKPVHECTCGKPPICCGGCGKPVHQCRCGWPPMCRDGCGRPAHDCRCWRPCYPRCCERCSGGNPCSSFDCGRPPVCTKAGYDCEAPCSLM